MIVNIKEAWERQEIALFMQLNELDAKRAEIDRLLASKKAELVKIQNRLKQLRGNVLLTNYAIMRLYGILYGLKRLISKK